VAYRKVGSGRAVILLHNAGSDHRIWERQVDELSKTHALYAVDLPGFGASDRPDLPYDLEFYVRFLRDFITGLALEKPVLVGNCIGSAIALEYGRRYPAEVHALILFNTLAGREMLRPGIGPNLPATASVRLLMPLVSLALRLSGRLRERLARELFGARDPSPTDPVFRLVQEHARDPKQVRSRWNLLRGLDSYGKVRNVEESLLPPTLLIWGESNRVLSRPAIDAFSEKIDPHGEIWLQGGGHLAMAEQPGPANDAIRNFLERGPGKG
jgi:pimeloyl-ACP methyl ester carboxylesterase